MDGIQLSEFTALSNVKGSTDEKLAHLLSIPDKRLNERQDSLIEWRMFAVKFQMLSLMLIWTNWVIIEPVTKTLQGI